MNSEMLFDALRSLELRWRDLAILFERLAQSLPDNPPPLREVPPPVGNMVALMDLIGVPTTPVPPVGPDSLRARVLREAGLIAAAITALQGVPNQPTSQLLTNAVAPFGAIEVFEQSRTRLVTGLGVIRNGLDPLPGFETLFPNPATNPGTPADTLEVAACRDRIVQLQDFITRSLQSFRELNEPSGFTERFDVRGIRGSVDNLSSYPILTSEAGGRVALSGSGSSGNGEVFSLRRSVQGAIRDVLGRNPRANDTRSFLSALSVSFAVAEVDGGTRVTWTPRSYAGQTDLGGGVTGGQASLAARAQVSLDKSMPLLEGLYSLREDSDDELVDATRSIVRNEFTEVVQELGTEGGPRVTRVDGLFDMLLAQPLTVPTQPQPVLGHLGLLQYELGLTAQRVNTLEEEANFTNFTALGDYIRSVELGWRDFRDRLLGRDLGTRFVLLSRALSVTAESVEEIYEAMDSVFVGSAERQVASFVHIHNGRPQRVHVGELFSWVTDFAGEEAPRLVQDGGRRGAEALIPTAQRLVGLVERFLQSLNFEPDLPDGMRQPRVRNPVRELLGHLRRIERLATDVRLPA